MAFHKSNLGRFSAEVEQYADLDGYVPEAGDHWCQMSTDGATAWDDDLWQEHVEAAVRATQRAEQQIAEWRQMNP